MKSILMILWILMAAVEGAHAAPALEYSTMIVDSTGAHVDIVLDLPDYEHCSQLDCTESGIYARVYDNYYDTNVGQIVKFNPDGEILFSTDYQPHMFVSNGSHYVDRQGNLYVALCVDSRVSLSCIPVTPDAFDADFNGGNDLVIQKYSPDGDLLYSSFLGGSGDDNVSEIAVDDSGGLYIYCWDISDDFPVQYENYDGTRWPRLCIITISPAFDDFHAYYTSAYFNNRMEVINEALYGGGFGDEFKYTLTGEPVWWIDTGGESPEMMDISHRHKPALPINN